VVKKGEVVLVHDADPRANCRLSVVEDAVTGNYGLIRSVNIHISNGSNSLSISRLYPLEILCEKDS